MYILEEILCFFLVEGFGLNLRNLKRWNESYRKILLGFDIIL